MRPAPRVALAAALVLAAKAVPAQTVAPVTPVVLSGPLAIAGTLPLGMAQAPGPSGLGLSPAPLSGSLTLPAAAVLAAPARGMGTVERGPLSSGRLAASRAEGSLAGARGDWGRVFDGGSGSGDVPGGGAPRRPIVEIREIPANDGQHSAAAVYRQGRWEALRDAAAQDSDFQDVYAVRTPIDSTALPPVAEVLAGVRGEFAIVRVPEAGVPALLERLHASGPHHGALVRLGGERLRPAAATPQPAVPISQTLALAVQAAGRVDPAQIQARVDELAAIHTRWYKSPTGKGVAERLAARYRRAAGGRSDVEVIVDDHGGRLPQPSLVVRIKGRVRPDEIVVLGSHIDSTGGDRAPGADDDASGTAVNFEVFRTLMEQGAAFDRTLEIHGYAAEEAGLLGSRDLAQRYARAGKKVVAMLQNDMNLYKPKGAADKIWLITDDTDAGLNAMLAQLAKRYAGVETGTGRLWGGTSDHASWTRAGYAASFPFEDPGDHNPNIHSERDTTEGMSFTQAAAFAKLGVAFAAHFAGASQPVGSRGPAKAR